MRKIAIIVAIAIVLSLPAAAQPNFDIIEQTTLTPQASPDCALGVKYDNTLAAAVSFSSGTPAVAMKFDLPAGTTTLQQVCTCFSRDSSGNTSTPFDVLIADDNGIGGAPGTILKTVLGNSVTGIPQFPANKFANVSITGLTLPDPSVYVIVRWTSGTGVQHCFDKEASTTQRTVYLSGDGGSTWSSTTGFPSPPHAWGIRVDTGSCVPSATAMCLNGNRFRVEATYATSSTSGQAQAVKLTEDTGYFWFFNSANVEVVLKVLNACGINNAYWVYAGGLTDQFVSLRVTDVQTGAVKIYTNPSGTPFQPIQDVHAFEIAGTCP